MKRISTILIILIAFFYRSFGQNESLNIQNDTIPEWNIFIHPEYSISFPTSWKFNQTGKYGSNFIIYIEELATNTLKVRVSLSLIVTDSIDKDLDMFVESAFNQSKSDKLNIKIIESEREKDYYKVVSTNSLFNIQMKRQQRIWMYNNKAYVITYAAGIDNYDNYVGIVEKVIQTFKIKK